MRLHVLSRYPDRDFQAANSSKQHAYLKESSIFRNERDAVFQQGFGTARIRRFFSFFFSEKAPPWGSSRRRGYGGFEFLSFSSFLRGFSLGESQYWELPKSQPRTVLRGWRRTDEHDTVKKSQLQDYAAYYGSPGSRRRE